MGHRREAELQALYGGEDPLTLITSRSGRKRDKRTALSDRMSGMLAGRPETINEAGMPTDAPVLGSYQKGTLGPIAARMAKERGLEFAEGRNPGSMFFKGPAGEKMALQHGDEFLDLVSVGGGKSGRARDLFEMLDELGTEGGAQVRWDTRHATPSGQRSLEKAISKGRLARNPAGAGWLSTAQKAGKRALKGAVGGVTGLLEPYFGAIQDPGLRQDLDPELQGTLDQILGTFGGAGRPQG
jgi:hypothetical protein